MKTKLKVSLLALVCGSFLGTPALAASTDTLPEEKRGVVIGGIIGAGVGGPIGAGLGAIIGGALIGKSVGLHRVNNELLAEVSDVRAESKLEEAEFKARIAQLNRALTEVRSKSAVASAAPEVPIQFKTGSHTIESHYEARLADIAEAVARRPDAKVSLAGFADRRGDDDYNLKLSASRVDQVKALLMSHGVDESQIETQAFGESRPVISDETHESHFFDRRVVMRFSIESNETPLAVR